MIKFIDHIDLTFKDIDKTSIQFRKKLLCLMLKNLFQARFTFVFKFSPMKD